MLITSDHGMDEDCGHYDNTEPVRRVPLWLAGRAWMVCPCPRARPVADLMLAVLGLAE